MNPDIDKEIKERVEEMRRQESVWCPYCQEEQSIEVKYHNVSYWGDKEDFEKINTCEHCGKKFVVEEKVVRTFFTMTMGEWERRYG